jgi:hypothetical protein
MTGIEQSLAFYRARKLVVEELRRQGYRLTQTTASEISTLARDYLSRHEAECLTWAAQTIWKSPVLRKMVARELAQRAKAIQKSPSNPVAKNARKSALA